MMKSIITPRLWFDREAEKTAQFYTSVFENSKIGPISRYGDNLPLPAGTALAAMFTLDGQEFMALNGGPVFKFTEALEPVATATTVRVRNGRRSISDGPFAETKEQLAGFYLTEARDLDEAIQLASKMPPARVGSIEVRPIRPIRERPRSGKA